MSDDIKNLKMQVNSANSLLALISILLVFTMSISLLSHSLKDKLIKILLERIEIQTNQ